MAVGGPAFSSVRKAREALRERAHELLNEYINICKQAAAAGDYETAQKGFQYLLSHIPNEEGERLIDIDVDKKVIADAKPTGPTIQIGLSIGGINKPALPAAAVEIVEVIEVTDGTE